MNGLTALSLLVCVAMGGLWVRSHHRMDSFQWMFPGGMRVLTFRSGQVQYASLTYPEPRGSRLHTTFEWRVYRGFSYQPPEGFSLLGFNWHHADRTRTPSFDPAVWNVDSLGWEVPFWFPCVSSAVVAGALLAKRRRAKAHGLCDVCGYDLRASKDRCPECGAAIPSSSSSSGGVE